MWLCMSVLLLLGAVESRKPLSTPRKVTAKVLSPHSVEVSWRDPDLIADSGAKVTRLYVVRYKEVDGAEGAREVFESIRTRNRKVKLLGLTPNTTYEILVKIIRNKTSSAWSKAIKVTTDGFEDKVHVIHNLTATAVAPDAVLLSWQPPEQTNDVVAYAVLTHLANGRGRQRKVLTTNETLEYKVQNLRPHLSYNFRVQTILIHGPHPVSLPVQAHTLSDLQSGTPKDVNIEIVNSSFITVTWQPPSPKMRNEQLLGYTLQYKVRGSGSDHVTSVATERGVRTYSIPDVADTENFMVRVAANTVSGPGPYTEWESAFVTLRNVTEGEVRKYEKDEAVSPSNDRPIPDLTPSPPTEVRVVNKTGSAVTLAWQVPVTRECCPVVAYKIMIKSYNDSREHEIVRGTTHVHLTELTPSTLYGVNISALSMIGESKPSQELRFSSSDAAPPAIMFFEAAPINVGGDANLTCKGVGYELPRIDWFISAGDGDENIVRVLDSDSDIAETVTVTATLEAHDRVVSSLLMHKVTFAAQREFICVARNSRGSEKRRLFLAVNDPPRIVTSQGTSAALNSKARLVCEAYGRPVPEILWIHSASGAVYDERQRSEQDPVYASSNLQDSNNTRLSHLVVDTSHHNSGAYKCVARSRAGTTEVTVFLNVTVPKPGPVHKIQAVPLSPSRVSVSWLPPLNYGYNIAYYQVTYRKKHGGQPLVFNTSRVGTELYSLDPSTEYLVGVIAGGDRVLGDEGPEMEVMTLSNDGLQPSNVSVKALNSSIIQLDWEAPPNISQMYIRGYNIYTRREEEDRIEKLFIRGSSSKQFLIGLGRDDTYYLKISTMLTWGYEAHSAWIRIQKRSEAYLPPGKPINVTASAKRNEITLIWEPPFMAYPALQPKGGHLKGYKIVYGPLNDPLNISRVSLGPDITEYVVKGLAPSTNYMISIRAFSDVGDGEPVYTRTTTQAHPPSMVQNAVAQPVSSTEIHVRWDPPKRGQVTQYHIRYWRPGRKDKQSAWMSGNNQNYVAGSLRKNSNYRFEIIPYNGELLGEGIVIFSYTYGDKPDGAPVNVSINPVNSTTLRASWSPPDPEKANGDVTGYKLVLRTNEGSRMASFKVPGTVRNFTFFNMPVAKTYKFRMAAVTINGTGVFSPWVESTFSPPLEKPSPPQNLSVTATETSLTLQWRSPKFTGLPVHGYVVGYGQFIPEVYRHILSNSQTSYVIKSLKPDSEYIVSVRAFNHIGESSPAFIIVRTRPVPVLATPMLAPVKLTAVSESPVSLRLSWVDPALSDSQKVLDGRVYLIRFSPLSGETYSYFNTSHLQHTLSALEPATMYEVSVKVVRGNNSSSWSLPVVNSTQETAPSTAPEKIIVSPLPNSPSFISLKWSEPRYPNGKIEEYIIYLTSEPTIDTKLWLIMRTEKKEVKIKDIIPHTSYYFKLQARNAAGYGPLSETVVFNPPFDTRAIPANVTVTGLHGNMSTTVKVAWTLPDIARNQITGYMVHYTNNILEDADWTVQAERGLDTVVGLEYNMTYYFKVQARYSAAYGPFSKIVSYVTMPQLKKPADRSNVSPDVNNNTKAERKTDRADNIDDTSKGVSDNNDDLYDTGDPSIINSYDTDINITSSFDGSTDYSNVYYDVVDSTYEGSKNITSGSDDFNTDDESDRNMNTVNSTSNADVTDNSGSSDYKEYMDYDESLGENGTTLPDLKYEDNYHGSAEQTSSSDDNIYVYANTGKDIPNVSRKEVENVEYLYFDTLKDKSNASHSNTSHKMSFEHHSSENAENRDVSQTYTHTSEEPTNTSNPEISVTSLSNHDNVRDERENHFSTEAEIFEMRENKTENF